MKHTKGKKIGLMIFMLTIFAVIPITKVIAEAVKVGDPAIEYVSNSLSADNPLTNGGGLAIKEEIHKEFLYEWGGGEHYLGTIMLPMGSVIHINYTVLASSNSSVFFVPIFKDKVDTLWDPVPSNLTLAPGDSFAETYTVLTGTSSGHSEFAYYASVITENSSATIHWWYEVLVTGKISTVGILFLSGTLILISFIAILHSKRKTIKINI
ncbi:MAG: hypothetical protein ACTSPM_07805 [Candidatus Heimdallarchaeota archaeon]